MTLHQSWFARDAREWTCEPPDSGAAAFHRRLPGYAATPLVEAPGLAAELGVGRLFVKTTARHRGTAQRRALTAILPNEGCS
jgi:diaminopropionate ammonia-lyase